MRQIAQLEKGYMKGKVPPFKSGDTVKVHVKIREGDKERIQVFQGTVIGRRGGGTNETFTVRKISAGIGVERVFPLHSPNLSKIERIRMGKVRRAKLYYLRGLTGKSARIEEKLDDKNAAIEQEKEIIETEKPKAKAKAKPVEDKVKKEPKTEIKAEEPKAKAKPDEEVKAEEPKEKAKTEEVKAGATEEAKAEEAPTEEEEKKE